LKGFKGKNNRVKKGFKKQLIFPEIEKSEKNVVDKTFSDIYDRKDFSHNN